MERPKRLSKKEIIHFIEKGYIRLEGAFTRQTADAAVEILWKDLPYDRMKPETWTEPVVRLGMYEDEPFISSVNSPFLHTAFDQLIGKGQWIPCHRVGTFPVRFPSPQQPVDTGKHVDASFPGDDPTNYFEWRINARSKGRALLLLILYSDVSETDAPTVIFEGSHRDVAKLLSQEGERGLSFWELSRRLEDLPLRQPKLATGSAGTIYLCHPFLVHSAQAHRGKNPRFMAQPPLLLGDNRSATNTPSRPSPLELAIRLGIHGTL